MTSHTTSTHAPISSPSRAWVVVCVVVGMVLPIITPSLAHAQDGLTPSPLTNLPALTSFALTSDASPQLHVLLDQRPIITHHKDLHVMCDDARQRQRKRHWVFPTILSLSRVVTHNGVVLSRPTPEQPLDATARIVPTLSLNTFGAKLRISF